LVGAISALMIRLYRRSTFIGVIRSVELPSYLSTIQRRLRSTTVMGSIQLAASDVQPQADSAYEAFGFRNA
jgi:hypothetical protein